MRSDARSSQTAFRRAQVRLTAWYVGALAVFLTALGTTVFLVQRTQLERGIDSGLHVTAQRLVGDYRGHPTRWLSDIDAVNAGFRYHVSLWFRTGDPAGASRVFVPRVPGLPDRAALLVALQRGSDLRTIETPAGHLRVYSVRLNAVSVVQVARSMEPEDQSLEDLLAVLLVGGAGSLAAAAVGGWFLAGKSLAPLRLAFERQQSFVGDASHELRTPLAVIRANAEFLQSSQPDSVEIADIVSETDRLSALVDALLALARGEAADRPARDLFDLGSLVEQACDAMQPLAGEREVGLRVETAHGVHVQGDREQLRQLVVILVDNALRYTPGGGDVEVAVERSGDTATVIVRDTGIGIDQAALGRVFDRFYRADEARNRDSGGAGLGLAIARQLVEEHGGRISVESRPGRGSTFTVRLPLATPQRAGLPV
jgi:signal transduction histidine kinase